MLPCYCDIQANGVVWDDLTTTGTTSYGKDVRQSWGGCDAYRFPDIFRTDEPRDSTLRTLHEESRPCAWYWEVIYPAFVFSGLAHRLELMKPDKNASTYTVVYKDTDGGSAEEVGNFTQSPNLLSTVGGHIAGTFAEPGSGDIVALLIGAKLPILLRPDGDDFEFLRFTFVRGTSGSLLENFWQENALEVRYITLC